MFPGQKRNEHHQQQERIEEKDRLLRREQGPEESHVEGRLERIVCGQFGSQAMLFLGKQSDIGVEERSEAVELVKAIQQKESGIHGEGSSSVYHKAIPQRPRAHTAEPQ